MGKYRVAARFLNGDCQQFIVEPCESHEAAQKLVKASQIGVASMVSLKIEEPIKLNLDRFVKSA